LRNNKASKGKKKDGGEEETKEEKKVVKSDSLEQHPRTLSQSRRFKVQSSPSPPYSNHWLV